MVPDIQSIAAVVTSLETAGNIAKAMIGLRDGQAVQSKLIELNSVIIAAQESAMSAHTNELALIDRIRELEKELAKMKAWDADKKRYKLEELPPGVFAYALKQGMARGEPFHRICARCYQRGTKVVLQSEGRTDSLSKETFVCHECNSRLSVDWSRFEESQADNSLWKK